MGLDMTGLAIFRPGPSPVIRLFVLVTEAVLFVVCVTIFVRALLLFAAPLSAAKMTAITHNDIVAPVARPFQHFNFTRDPFHRAPSQTAFSLGRGAPETSLDLKLFGLRSGAAGGNNGSAIIETPDNVQRVYYIGDEVTKGVVLKVITRDYIVLSQAGRLERLTFERQQASVLKSATPSFQNPDSSAIGANSFSGAAFLSIISLKRTVKDGQTLGYEVRPKSAAINLNRFGLQAGDILTAIGEEDLTHGQPEFGPLLNGLSNARALNFSILRNGRPLTVKVDLQ